MEVLGGIQSSIYIRLQQQPSTSQRLQSVRGGSNSVRCGIAEPSGQPAPLGQKTQYKDGVFEKVFMALFARKMEKFSSSGNNNNDKKMKGLLDYDYDSFVDVSRIVLSLICHKRIK